MSWGIKNVRNLTLFYCLRTPILADFADFSRLSAYIY